jgi:hypothetical protein
VAPSDETFAKEKQIGSVYELLYENAELDSVGSPSLQNDKFYGNVILEGQSPDGIHRGLITGDGLRGL